MPEIILEVQENNPIELVVEDNAGLDMTVAEQIVIGGAANLQSKSVSYTPSTTAISDTVTADSGYDGLDEVDVSVAAVPVAQVTHADAIINNSTGEIDCEITVGQAGYIASGTHTAHAETTLDIRTSADLQEIGATVGVPAGYYPNSVSKTLPTASLSATAAKGAVSNHSVSVTPTASVTSAGYKPVGSKTGTAVTVTASELVSGTKSITSNGTGIDVTEYAAVDVNVSGGGSPTLQNKTVYPSSSDQSITADTGYDGLGTVTAKAVTTTNLTAANIVSGVTVEIGDADDSDRIASVTGTAQTGFSYDDIAAASIPTGDVVLSGTRIESYAFAYRTASNSWTVYGPNVTYLGQNTFRGSTYLTSARFPALSSYHSTAYMFYGCSRLAVIDFGTCNLKVNTFTNCSALKTLVLRKSSAIQTCASTAVFSGTPFASGGSGGTIYIPKALYDHLGDGTSLDYKAASNWSTYDGYGTITWAKLEGSAYE